MDRLASTKTLEQNNLSASRIGSFQALFLWILKLFGRNILTTPSYSLSKMSQKNILKKSRDHHILAKKRI